jgi:DNA-binding FadR family transcriptional regulator
LVRHLQEGVCDGTTHKEASLQLAEGRERLYQKLAWQLFAELAPGRYAVGDRLPAERELYIQCNVSRPAVREAMIALEVQGMIEVRTGSAGYVRSLPSETDAPGFTLTGFELMEARLLLAKARTANIQPVVEEHRAVLNALRVHDPAAARTAMPGHMASVIDHLLFAAEEEAVEAGRRNVATTRERSARAVKL